jgi:hypothetical protein
MWRTKRHGSCYASGGEEASQMILMLVANRIPTNTLSVEEQIALVRHEQEELERSGSR